MSLKSKIEAVIYASEEPVTLAQLIGVLAGEAQSELDELAAQQRELPLEPGAGTERVDVSASDVRDSAEVEDRLDVPDAPEEAAAQSGTDAALPLEQEQETSPQPAEDVLPDAARMEAEKRLAREREKNVREYLRHVIDTLMRDYAESDRGIEIREVAGGFRMATKPEYHDAVRGFVRSLKPALKLSLQALETLAVVAYKQPVTAAEISEIRGVDSAGVLGGLLTRKLIQTAGRKQVIGRPMLYKTSKEFLVRFGLKDIQELPSMEEFERMAGELNEQEDLPMEAPENVIERANARGDAERIQQENDSSRAAGEAVPDEAPHESSPQAEVDPGTQRQQDDAASMTGTRKSAAERSTEKEAEA